MMGKAELREEAAGQKARWPLTGLRRQDSLCWLMLTQNPWCFAEHDAETGETKKKATHPSGRK